MSDDSSGVEPGAESGGGLDGFRGLPGRTDQASLDHHVLTSAADRLDDLAEMAELMGDEEGAARLKAAATNRRLEAFEALDRD